MKLIDGWILIIHMMLHYLRLQFIIVKKGEIKDMKRQVLYLYLGTNGSILSPVHLEDTYYVRRIRLFAEEGKKLTKDNVNFVQAVTVSEEDEPNWKEV
jgi:hypothetical protein